MAIKDLTPAGYWVKASDLTFEEEKPLNVLINGYPDVGMFSYHFGFRVFIPFGVNRRYITQDQFKNYNLLWLLKEDQTTSQKGLKELIEWAKNKDGVYGMGNTEITVHELITKATELQNL